MPNTATLSADAKDALARDLPEASHCRAALRDGLFFFGTATGATRFRTQRAAIARLGWSLLEDRKAHPISKRASPRLYRQPVYEIETGARPVPPRPAARCDRRMMLRAAFLACGSLAAPARGYHLEFVPPSLEACQRLASLLRGEGLEVKTALRRGRQILYLKGIDAIAQVLASIGASSALLRLEDVRALKETKNRIRRLVNTEAANVDRAARAAAAQRERIALVADAYGLRNLSAPLREIAELRLNHPTETLAELGARCRPPVKKSTVNGRIAALLRLAARLESHDAVAAGAYLSVESSTFAKR
ncbi:MAG: DNA-binding protein WhiA [Vulcanimicrobiaceae bacterium]